MLICMQKINFITNSFLIYCKEKANLLFWVIGAFLATQTLNDWINLKKSLMFICRQKINFIFHNCLQILQRHSKLFILRPFDMPGYAHLKLSYQLVKNFRVYLQAKNDFNPPRFSGEFRKICKLLILSTFGMSVYTHPKW